MHDVPLALNVAFEAHAPNPSGAAVLGSKASGEPSMIAGIACMLAVYDAIRAARQEAPSGGAPPLQLDLPLTVEKVQLLCGVAPERFVLA